MFKSKKTIVVILMLIFALFSIFFYIQQSSKTHLINPISINQPSIKVIESITQKQDKNGLDSLPSSYPNDENIIKKQQWLDRTSIEKNQYAFIYMYEITGEFGKPIAPRNYIKAHIYTLDSKGNIIDKISIFDFKISFEESIRYVSNIKTNQLAKGKGEIFDEIGQDNLDQQLQKQNQEAERKASIPKLCGEPNIVEETRKHFHDESWIVPRKVTYKEFEDCWYAINGNRFVYDFGDFIMEQIEKGKVVE